MSAGGMAGAAPGSARLFEGRLGLLACLVLAIGNAALLGKWWAEGYSLFGAHGASLDFGVFWGAGRLALAGNAGAAYDWTKISGILTALLAPPGRIPAFFYPPVFFLVLAPLAALPFIVAAALWVAATIAGYLAAIRHLLPGPRALLAALAAPSTLINLFYGQTGLLTAALFGGALAVLDRRPMVAGVLIGMLAYKPQFAVLFPFFLALTGRWRVFLAAAATVLVLLAATALLFGTGVFADYARALPVANGAFLHPSAWDQRWGHLASLYGMLRSLGVRQDLAWLLHIAVAAAAAVASLRLATGAASYAVKAAALTVAAFVVTPYSEGNDVALLTVAMAFLVADGMSNPLSSPQRLALAAAFVSPLAFAELKGIAEYAGSADMISVAPLGPTMCALLAWVIGRRAAAARPALMPRRTTEA
jgi:alpha-1,2-mannosyltransferase